jgi:hypothetical protein
MHFLVGNGTATFKDDINDKAVLIQYTMSSLQCQVFFRAFLTFS